MRRYGTDSLFYKNMVLHYGIDSVSYENVMLRF